MIEPTRKAPSASAGIRPGRGLVTVLRVTLALVVTLAASAFLFVQAARIVPVEVACPDFLAMWTGSALLAQGQDPYDPDLQAQLQRQLGWERDKQGVGVFEFLPFYYPPWFAILLFPFAAIPWEISRYAWMVSCLEMLGAAAVVLARVVPGVSALSALLATAMFGPAYRCILLGQTTPLLLLLVACAWWCLEKRRDAAAGGLLALLTIKPQLTVFPILALLAWSSVQHRWRVAGGFGVAMAALAAASTLLFPTWLPSMVAAPLRTPLITEFFPGYGTTWPVILSAFGIDGAAHAIAWALVALPAVALLARESLSGSTRLADVVALSLIVPFFASPYAHAYDFEILLVPVLVMAGSRLPTWQGATLLFLLTIPLHLHYVFISTSLKRTGLVVGRLHPEYTSFWVPVLVAIFWAASSRRTVERRSGGFGSTPGDRPCRTRQPEAPRGVDDTERLHPPVVS